MTVYFTVLDGCTGSILAFDGKDGSILWKIATKAEVFELKCPGVDIDYDGTDDCFASGRHGTLVAFNPATGTQQ